MGSRSVEPDRWLVRPPEWVPRTVCGVHPSASETAWTVRTGTRSSEQLRTVPRGHLNTSIRLHPASYLRRMSDARTRAESRVAAVVDYWIDDALVRAMTLARIEARVDPRIRARLVTMTDAITIGRIGEWMTDERVAGRIRELLHDHVDARIDERIDARIVAMTAPDTELAGEAVTDQRIDHWIDDALISARVRSQISSRIEDLIDYRSRALIRSRVHLDPEDG